MKRINTQSPYEILGVPQDSSADAIKAAYKKLAKLHHPDLKGGNAERMAEINWAYELLCDAEQRAHFDRFGYEQANEQLTEVEQGILRIWGEMIGAKNFAPSSDFIGDISRHITRLIAPLEAEILKTRGVLPKLKLLRKRIRRKDGKPNTIFHIHLDKTIAAAEDHIAENQRKIEVHNKQVEYLKDFEFKWDQPDQNDAFTGMMMSVASYGFGSTEPPPPPRPTKYRSRREGR